MAITRVYRDAGVCLIVLMLLFGCGGGGGGGGGGTDGTVAPVDNTPKPVIKAAHIHFLSATPNLIALKNTGGPARSETSVLVFSVVDVNGAPVSGKTVDFVLSTAIGGLYLSASSATSNASGQVQTTVNSGTVSTEVKVHATLRGSSPAITTASDALIVSTGLADQNSITLAAASYDPKTLVADGAAVPVIFHAADHFNNFVPNGTVVYFTTELGSIAESGVIQNGRCTVTWLSGNPRDSYCDNINPPCDHGVATVTAFLVGEESFTDVNGNGRFDPGDVFDTRTDMPPDVFRDDNNDGIRQNWEPYWDFNNNGVFDGTPNGIYNGSLCSDEARAQGLCTRELVYVRKEITINMPYNKGAHLNFISAAPQLMALKNTGGPPRSETSVVVFEVVDINGNPVADQIVDFALSTSVGGLYLSLPSAVSNAQGRVQTTVNAGSVSTEVKVRATVRGSNPLITLVSDTLIISTGLPDQNSISLSRETLNPEGWDYNNVEVPVIFQAADHFNNFVPDGTVVYFTTELGSIDQSGVLINGVCEVIWRSGNPRYANCPPDRTGLSTITAFLAGEESFFDRNSNAYFDPGDTFDLRTDMAPDVFRDDNGSGFRDACEPFWDYNSNGVYDSTPNGIYNGSLCSDEAERQGLCTKTLVYVRADTKILMSGSFAHTFSLSPTTLDLRGKSSGTVLITIADVNGNPMPAGSRVTLNLSNGTVLGDNPFSIPNTLSQTTFSVTIVPSENDGKTTGVMTATITTPFENKTSGFNSVTILDDN